MGRMKDIDIMATSLELDHFYNVEYMDDDVAVKRQHVKYIGKNRDLFDGTERLVFQTNDGIHDLMINIYTLMNLEECQNEELCPKPIQLKKKRTCTSWKETFLDALKSNKYPLQVKTKRNDEDIQIPVVYSGHCYVEELGVDTLSFIGTLNGSTIYVHITPDDIRSKKEIILFGRARDDEIVYEQYGEAHLLKNPNGYEWNTDELIIGNAYQLVSKEDDKRVNTLLTDIDSSWLRFLTAEKQNTMLPSFGQIFISINHDTDSGWDVYALGVIK